MRSVLFHIGTLSIHSYGLMIGLGFIAAVGLASFRAKKRGLDGEAVYSLAITGIAWGIVGARLLYYITDMAAMIETPSLLWDFSYGYVVYGGIILGVLAAYIYCRIKALDFRVYLELCIPSIPLAQGLGRIGCFLAGCCYGKPTDAWFGVVFPFGGDALIPTQLISSAGDFLIAFLLLRLSKKERLNGCVLFLYMLLYGIGRFLVEFLRGDVRGAVGLFSTSQFISLFVFAAGLVGLFTKLLAKKSSVACKEALPPE